MHMMSHYQNRLSKQSKATTDLANTCYVYIGKTFTKKIGTYSFVIILYVLSCLFSVPEP